MPPRIAHPTILPPGAARVRIGLLLAVCLGLLCSPVTAQAPANPERLQRIIVRFKTEAAPAARGTTPQALSAPAKVQALALTTTASGQLLPRLNYLRPLGQDTHVSTFTTPLDRPAMREALRAIAANPEVQWAEIDEIVYPYSLPNDPSLAQQWGLQAASTATGGANFVSAWGRTTNGSAITGSGVVVAVIDTGYRPHPDLVNNIVPGLLPGYDFVSAPDINPNDGDLRDADAQDPGDYTESLCTTTTTKNTCSSWHGTHVAGIVAAEGNNNRDVTGAAYGAKILPVRALGGGGGFTSDIVDAMRWAVGFEMPVGPSTNMHPARVLNMSLGNLLEQGQACSLSFQNAVDDVISAGAVVVAATGNEGASWISTPANCSGVIAVTAHDSTGRNAGYANIGAGTALSAPGSSIYSTSNAGKTVPQADILEHKWGTSMAAPHVAAAAALLLQIKPSLTPTEVTSYLRNNTRYFSSSDVDCFDTSDCGSGLLDANKAVRALLRDIDPNTNTNSPPTMAAIAAQSVRVNQVMAFKVNATDPDGDTVSFGASELPQGATFDESTGDFRWEQPTVGSYSVIFTPSDGELTGTPQIANITILPKLPINTGNQDGGGGASGVVELLALLLVFLVSRPGARTRLSSCRPATREPR